MAQNGKQKIVQDRGVCIICDLDKTYLDTRFESKISLLKVPFEKASDKNTIRAAGPFLTVLKNELDHRYELGANLTFLTASPPEMRRTVLRKLRNDGLRVDGMIFKNVGRNLRPGRLYQIKNHLPYKLPHLLRLAQRNPQFDFVCFGDDWEMDSLIYSIFGDIVHGAFSEYELDEVLEWAGLKRADRSLVVRIARKIKKRPRRVRILIHRARFRDRSLFACLGESAIGYDSYLQLAARAFQEQWLSRSSVERLFAVTMQQWSPAEAWLEVASGINHGTLKTEGLGELSTFLEYRMGHLPPEIKKILAGGALAGELNQNAVGAQPLFDRGHIREKYRYLIALLHTRPEVRFDLLRTWLRL